jgi:DNA-binding SARP family transcriptional activator
MNLFWPDTAEDVARRNLSRLLSQTRSLLPDGRALQAVGDAVALCRQSMWPDVSRFTELYSKRELLAVDREEIVALYRGPFLDGFALDQNPEFELWVSREQSCWEQRYLQTLLFLTDYYSAAGEYQAAIINAERYLALGNLYEEVHRRLMSLLALTGNSGAARRQFEACRQALHSELKVEPLEETCALHEAIARGQISAACNFPADPSCTPYSITPPRLEGKTIRSTGDLYRHVTQGWGKFLLLAGTKNGNQSPPLSSLARSFEEIAEVVRVASYPGERQHPYHAVGELFRALLLSKQPLPVGLPRLWLTEISRLLPELHLVYPDLPAPPQIAPEEARARLFEALRQALISLSNTCGPLLHTARRSSERLFSIDLTPESFTSIIYREKHNVCQSI